jgi:hypothetical protein
VASLGNLAKAQDHSADKVKNKISCLPQSLGGTPILGKYKSLSGEASFAGFCRLFCKPPCTLAYHFSINGFELN